MGMELRNEESTRGSVKSRRKSEGINSCRKSCAGSAGGVGAAHPTAGVSLGGRVPSRLRLRQGGCGFSGARDAGRSCSPAAGAAEDRLCRRGSHPPGMLLRPPRELPAQTGRSLRGHGRGHHVPAPGLQPCPAPAAGRRTEAILPPSLKMLLRAVTWIEISLDSVAVTALATASVAKINPWRSRVGWGAALPAAAAGFGERGAAAAPPAPGASRLHDSAPGPPAPRGSGCSPPQLGALTRLRGGQSRRDLPGDLGGFSLPAGRRLGTRGCGSRGTRGGSLLCGRLGEPGCGGASKGTALLGR